MRPAWPGWGDLHVLWRDPDGTQREVVIEMDVRTCRCGCGKLWRAAATSPQIYAGQPCALKHSRGKYTWHTRLDFSRQWTIGRGTYPEFDPRAGQAD